jgi:hypothetical protein
MRTLTILAALVVMLLVARPAAAHPALTSAVWLDFDGQDVAVELQLPVDQLELALERPLVHGADGRLAASEQAALATYLAGHVGMTAASGEALTLRVLGVTLGSVDGAAHVTAQLALHAPEGVSLAHPTWRDDAILHRVVTHKILVLVRHDLERGVLHAETRPLATMRYQHETLAIDRAGASGWRAFRSIFALGTRHIAEGSDHLLFLLLLLLPAALVARGRRWAGPQPLAATARHIVTIVTAFTLGHSVTLAAGALGVLQLPSRPVETLVAASILVSAVHAALPIFARREAWIAAGFGLVHGLAFSTVLSGLGVHGATLVQSLLAFNLGIEAMQLVVVALCAPWLVLLARSSVGVPARILGAAAGGLVASAWIAERAFGAPDPLGPLVDRGFAHPAVAIGSLAAVALLATVGSVYARAVTSQQASSKCATPARTSGA